MLGLLTRLLFTQGYSQSRGCSTPLSRKRKTSKFEDLPIKKLYSEKNKDVITQYKGELKDEKGEGRTFMETYTDPLNNVTVSILK